MLHQRGLSDADSLLLDGYSELLSRGDGLAALARFKSATERAPRRVSRATPKRKPRRG